MREHRTVPFAERHRGVTITSIAPLNTEEQIDSRIRVHDENQFEVKLDYVIDHHAKENRYQVDAYFFVPRSLGIGRDSYSRDQFYADAQAYIRFKTPEVPLTALLDGANKASPLTRIPRLVEQANGPARVPIAGRPLADEVRLLCCLVRVDLRNASQAIRDAIERLSGRAGQRKVLVADLRTAIDTLHDELEAVLQRFRGLRHTFVRPNRPEWVRELYAYADEYLSLCSERYLTSIIARLDKSPDLRAVLEESRSRLRDKVMAEQAHRQGAGYVSLLGLEGDRTRYAYRIRALKKFMSGVLFLQIDRQKEGRGIAQIIAGIAAAIAMLFSTIAAIWSQEVYGLNSFPFVVAVVGAYVLKDRIKEWMRTYFASKVGRWLPDYSLTIRDPVNGIVVGRCRETFTYVKDGELPPEIYGCRHSDSTSVLEPESKLEVVLRYVKHISIHSKRIADFHGRRHDINDIIRFSVSSFLARMDDPVERVEAFDPEQDRVLKVKCPKTYHLNVVMVLRLGDREVTMERFRVVLDKTGIRQLEHVPLLRTPHSVPIHSASLRRAHKVGSSELAIR